jgi:hypothetical protein
MVGNESHAIMRMLESVEPYIDYWVIQCNGNDDTQKIIEEFFREKNKPGFTYQIEWNFPGWNRNHTLQTCLKADHGCDWILRMDADETLKVDDDFEWEILEDTTVQSYNLTAVNGDLQYFRTWFWNAKLPWFFALDKRHETIHLPEIGEEFQRLNMPYGFRQIVMNDGVTWTVPRKFLRDALELEIDKVVGNTVLEDNYHLWYIAKSYSDCYGNYLELPFGKIHSIEYARRSIWYFQRFLEARHGWYGIGEPESVCEMGYFTLILMADAYKFMEDYDEAERLINLAPLFNSSRNEHLLWKAKFLSKQGRISELRETLLFMLKPERTNPFPYKSSFLIDGKAYYDSSNFLQEWLERIDSTAGLPTISDESLNFFS